MKPKTDWKKYPAHSLLDKGSNCFWQKLIFERDDIEIFAEIVEWELEKKSYMLKIQIPYDISITGMTIDVDNFSYEELDFDIIENHARKIIRSLISEGDNFSPALWSGLEKRIKGK